MFQTLVSSIFIFMSDSGSEKKERVTITDKFLFGENKYFMVS